MSRPVPRDLWLVVPLLVVGLGGTRAAAHLQQGAARAPDHWAYLLILLAVLTLLLRRLSPAAMLGLSTAPVAAYLALGYPFGPVLLTLPAAAFLVASAWPRDRAVAAELAAVGVLGVAGVARCLLPGDRPWGPTLGMAAIWLPVVAALFAVGTATRARRESASAARAEQARRAASEERLRMAQELHDVVGHGLAVIAMQAGVALHLMDRDPEQARVSLQGIRSLSRESLDGLRVELDRLRGGTDPAARRPAPGLADLALLADRVTAGGVDVRLTVRVRADEAAPALGAIAYRVVQESLTNVLRHAAAERAEVRVERSGDELVVTVSDPGRGSADLREGNGIRGMRERVEALGGRLRAGSAPSGGFEVEARLPWSPG
jgi:signal transduction histidine kinase